MATPIILRGAKKPKNMPAKKAAPKKSGRKC